MKKYIIYTLIVTIAVFLGSCNKDDIDTKRSIFDPTEVYEPNGYLTTMFTLIISR